MRKPLLAAIAVGAALAAVGSVGAQGDAASLAALVDGTQRGLGRLAAVQVAAGDSNLNVVRGVGGLAGVGLGIAVGSVATYVRWRR
ncbi:hypothetical protein GCM10008995_03360 [Halobellus salinus]|uniref:Uncharacterized protein n=1 Tax=Halobellus salinus TaxID=931585 RepID=A0A830E795_9EURY|nr:hypothetical protein [Halobellus salinus]GGI96670.1 hypothetical protein GCM10008995_03360 [Halobellus salinus]SMP13373.1 hypothetical protein SAMN06265347_104185 [Halobellus salinus]